ncbi:TetR/AcrR family transcriptional regulator C-terminal domain-containing protein [Micromonospora sp. LOL_024]|uniref:TetR/AcrR family transcriptional regulator C-terminal domain-containing protein n=1 Tax=Micromonospora sp. LOL_024 TaxID=3345412 RepID=UPI003A8A52CF
MVVERLLGEFSQVRAPDSETVLRQYPGVAAWLIEKGPAGPQAYRLLEELLTVLSDAGFDDKTVVRGAAAIMGWTFTRVAIEDSADDRVRRRSPTRATAFLNGLTDVAAAAHPAATRFGSAFFTLPLPDFFDAGIDWILAGVVSERVR